METPDKCVGWWGRAFGHTFKAFEIKRESTPPDPATFKLNTSGYGVPIVNVLEALTKYVVVHSVRCARCGKPASER